MKIFQIKGKKKIFLFGFLSGVFLSGLILLLSFLLPGILTSNYYKKSLDTLRSRADVIKNEFGLVLKDLEKKKKMFSEFKIPEKTEALFPLFQKIRLNPENEGIAYYDAEGNLALWSGIAVDVKPVFLESRQKIPFEKENGSLLLRDKASVLLLSFLPLGKKEGIVFYRRLAFTPRFQAADSAEYHFLKPKLLRNCRIDYWDFREDVSGFEKIFERHKDEYLGQPRLQDEIQTLFFPLRNENNSIVATATISSVPLSLKFSVLKENFLFVFFILLEISLAFFFVFLFLSASQLKKKMLLFTSSGVVTLAVLRLLFFPLSQLEKVRSLAIFSPASASFLSFASLTQSPADIFLSCLFLFLAVLVTAFINKDIFKREFKVRKNPIFPWTLSFFLILASFALLHLFQVFLYRIVLHSSLNLLRFSMSPSFILLHLSILLAFLVFAVLSFGGLRLTFRYSSSLAAPSVSFFIILGGLILFYREKTPLFLLAFQALLVIWIAGLALSKRPVFKKRILLLSALFFTFYIYTALHAFGFIRSSRLLEDSLQGIVKSQEKWAVFLLEQSLPEIEKKKTALVSFFQGHGPEDMAHRLWEKSLMAKFNWYSSLELQDAEGLVLSRFSLNIPELYRINFDLPVAKEWTFFHHSLSSMGRDRDFLIGYKDEMTGEGPLGKILITLSVDYDMLPLLYSANPYYDLVRSSSIPSLDQLDIGFAIHEQNGNLIYNPAHLSSGLPKELIQKISESRSSMWAAFRDKNREYQAFYFLHKDRIYSFLLPQKSFLNGSVEFIKLFLFYSSFSLAGILIFFLLFDRKRLKNPFRSFSNRVYLSFAAIALVPLLLFAFLTRDFFSRIYSQQFIEKAELNAGFARQVLEDFIYLQQEKEESLAIPPDDLVLWISSTISSDVNLYREGKLISSSRREFFDSGLLPGLIDGETHYKILYKNNPFFTFKQKIGDYSFHTLTLPYWLDKTLLLLSLPFPLEQQEVEAATQELIEFLFFISIFFITIAFLFARSIGSRIVTPIQRLLEGTKEVSSGNLDISLPHNHRDEMKTLFDGFNAMVKNLKKHEQELAEMGKKVAWADMARKVAHDIKNPLTPIQLSAEHLLKVYEDKKEGFEGILKESISYIIKEVENLRKIALEFLETSKETTLHKENLNLKELIEEIIRPYQKTLSERISVEKTREGDDFLFFGDKAKLIIALRNVFTNAIESMPGKGKIRVHISGQKEGLQVEIKDTGTGIDKENMAKIFEPDFSTKEGGTGLGLPIAKKIIEDHGGSLHISSEKQKGTTVRIKFF